MARKTKVARLGKRFTLIEGLFASLSDSNKTQEVFLALANAAGVTTEKARAHFQLALSMLPKGGK